MKRYKLKKELPCFPAGTIGARNGCGNLVAENRESQTRTVMFFDHELRNFPNILSDWLEEIPEQEKTVYDLTPGEECWTVLVTDLGYSPQQIKFDKLAQTLRLTGSLYLTKEDAEKDIVRNMALATIKRDTKGFKPDWENGDQEKYTAYFDWKCNELFVDYWTTYCISSIHFATREDAEASIKSHEKEWKTYLGVEE